MTFTFGCPAGAMRRVHRAASVDTEGLTNPLDHRGAGVGSGCAGSIHFNVQPAGQSRGPAARADVRDRVTPRVGRGTSHG